MPKRALVADDLLRFVFVGDPQISPDGKLVLFARKSISAKKKYESQLCTVDRKGRVKQWTQGSASAGGGRWSPDGQAFAFVADREKSGAQIYVISTSGGEARKLTELPEGSVGGLQWSPNGEMILFSFREVAAPFTKAAAEKREKEGGATPPIEIDDLWYRLDGDGYFGGQRHKLYLINVVDGKIRELYGSDAMGMYSFDWSPDSKEIAVIHSAKEKPLIGPPDDQIYRLKLNGKATKIAGLPAGDKSGPKWSPDGKSIAYVGDTDSADPWGVRNVKLYVVSAGGGEPRCLTCESDFCLGVGTLSDTKEAGFEASIQWAKDGSGLYLQIGYHGEQQLGWVEASGGKVKLLTSGKQCLTLGNADKAGDTIAATVTDPTHLPEIAVVEIKKKEAKVHTLTSLNSDFHEEVVALEPSEHWIPSTNGTKVHAWMLKPSGKGPFPAVLEVHGGPHAQYGWTYFHELQLLAAQGYVVVYSNPRGSKGYGEAFCAAIRGDWGKKDWEDVEAVTNWIAEQPFVNKKRIGVMGGSYGGFMTNWAIGHSKAYKAAITDRCVSNWVSMAGNSDFPLNANAYFGGVAWGNLKEIEPLWRQSPLAYFKGVKTPTLIIHSEGDLRCNVEQGEQVFHALQMQSVPSRFVRYPKETSHGMSRTGPPDLRLHRLGEIVAWWEKHL